MPETPKAAEPDLRLVYAKTTDGTAEIPGRQHDLSNVERRILILIDGQRRLADLPPFARPGDLGPIIDKLQAHGLIRLAGIVEGPLISPLLPDPEQTRLQLARVRDMLGGAFERELGNDGRVLEARLQDSISVEVARRVVREGIDTVARLRGKAVADRLAEISRRAFAAP
jgi:hypothetical protein